jgi:hypothetical protein
MAQVLAHDPLASKVADDHTVLRSGICALLRAEPDLLSGTQDVLSGSLLIPYIQKVRVGGGRDPAPCFAGGTVQRRAH